MVGMKEVIMDPSILDFGETNLNEFLQKIGGYHAYFAEVHADSMHVLGIYEQEYDALYGRRFRELKGGGNNISIPLAEAATKSDPDVLGAGSKVLAARLNKDLLSGFSKSIDKAFQAAMNFGYNKRKEMDKLNNEIYYPNKVSENDPDEMVANILKQEPFNVR